MPTLTNLEMVIVKEREGERERAMNKKRGIKRESKGERERGSPNKKKNRK